MARQHIDRSLAAHRASHTPEAISERLEGDAKQSYLGDFVLGAIDGAVTTLAVVAGVAGAGLSAGIIVILGVANLVADGFSMAASNFLGTRAENQARERHKRIEAAHIEKYPEGEREEIRQIFQRKGFDGDALEHIVETVTADKRQWIETMLTEELGLSARPRSAGRAAGATFIAFVIIGAIPLIPFIAELLAGFEFASAFAVSLAMTGVAFFFVGAAKGKFVEQRWWIAGLETLAVGGIAAILAYTIGRMLGNLTTLG